MPFPPAISKKALFADIDVFLKLLTPAIKANLQFDWLRWISFYKDYKNMPLEQLMEFHGKLRVTINSFLGDARYSYKLHDITVLSEELFTEPMDFDSSNLWLDLEVELKRLLWIRAQRSTQRLIISNQDMTDKIKAIQEEIGCQGEAFQLTANILYAKNKILAMVFLLGRKYAERVFAKTSGGVSFYEMRVPHFIHTPRSAKLHYNLYGITQDGRSISSKNFIVFIRKNNKGTLDYILNDPFKNRGVKAGPGGKFSLASAEDIVGPHFVIPDKIRMRLYGTPVAKINAH